MLLKRWDNSRSAAVLETPTAPLTTPLLKGAGGMATSKRTPEDRFWSKVQKTDGCWLWTGGTFDDGYGIYRAGSRTLRAHRYSWELSNGSIPPPGMCVCHTCDTPLCVRPDHFFLGTRLDNLRDASAKGRVRAQKITHCPKGHEYTSANTMRVSGTNGRLWRRCKACKRRGVQTLKEVHVIPDIVMSGA